MKHKYVYSRCFFLLLYMKIIEDERKLSVQKSCKDSLHHSAVEVSDLIGQNFNMNIMYCGKAFCKEPFI